MSVSMSSRTISAFHADDAVIDLTDFNIVIQFAQCVRNLSKTRRQSIWSQNVQLHHRVQSQTKLQHQIDDILLFLIIIYGKEQYPNEEEQLIAKLKVFITSSPFMSLKKYIQQKYFPLLRNEFINDNNYFASMIEDYATNKLQPNYITKTDSVSKDSINTIDSSIIYSKLEEKMMELFEHKFKQLENKINNIEKDVKTIKYAMSEEAKQNISTNTKAININNIINEINIIKKQLKLNKNKKINKNKCIIDKRESIKISVKKKKSSKKCKRKNSKLKENNKKKNELKKWMKNMELEKEYFNMFVDNGIDHLEMLNHISITDLGLLGINNSAHKIKIMQNIQKLKYEQRQSNEIKTDVEIS